jgi:O-antigen ligase
MRAWLPRFRTDSALPIGIASVAALAIGPLIVWAITEEKWRLLVLVAVVAVAPLVLRWPIAVAFGAYAFVLPFDSVALVSGMGGVTATRLLGIVAAGVLIAVGVVGRRLVKPPAVALWVVSLFLWATVTMIWAVNDEMSQARLITATSLVAMYIAAVSFQVSQRELNVVCVLTMIGGVLAAVAGLVLGFDADAEVRGSMTVGGQEANPNAIAHSLILPLAMTVGTLFAARHLLVKAAALVGTAVIAAGIFLTMSRSSVAALAIMMCVLLYRFRVRWQVLAVVAAVVAVLPVMPDLFFERIGRVLSGADATGSGRTEIWSIGLQAVGQFGLFGAGLANFPAVYQIYAYTAPRGLARGAHSEYLGTWVELGIIGLACFVMAVIGHLHASKPKDGDGRSAPYSAAIEAACVGFLLIGFFSDVLWRKAFWMPWILAVWASRQYAADDRLPEPHVRATLQEPARPTTRSSRI